MQQLPYLTKQPLPVSVKQNAFDASLSPAKDAKLTPFINRNKLQVYVKLQNKKEHVAHGYKKILKILAAGKQKERLVI